MDLDMFREGGHFNFLGTFDDFDGIQDLSVDNDFESCTSGDLTPSSQFCDGNLLTKDDFLRDDMQRIMGDWQQLVNAKSLEDSMNLTEEDLQRATIDMMKQFDENTPNTRNIRAGVKKIDVNAQKYIIKQDNDDDDDDIDVETISEGDDHPPVIEAGDLNTLLEQFEATELPVLPDYVKCDFTKNMPLTKSKIECKPEVVKIKQEIDTDVKINTKTTVTGHIKVDQNIVKKEICEKTVHIKKEKDIKVEPSSDKGNVKHLSMNPQKSSPTLDHSRHKQIVDALPQELINRIRESGKRKPISVIPPIAPNKRQRTITNKNPEICKQNDKMTDILKNLIYLDHDYCSPKVICVKSQKKDSGIESAEEEEHRMILSKQPMVKNADGKLMVSLLKVNTIRNEQIKKKTLNLDEYKKRREGVLKTSQNSSQNNSPFSSTCSSPLPEDEQTRLRKHREKLERMAIEVLNAQRKVKKEPDPPAENTPIIPEVVPIPANIKMITLVSIGVNTDLNLGKNLDPLSSVEQLEQIKPLLEQVSDKINCNSLITSVIENIPKVISSCEPTEKAVDKTVEQEHGEDKTIVYLHEKEKKKVVTKDVGVQTNINLIPQMKASRYRRRISSTSSNMSISSREGSPVRSRYDRWRKEKDSNGDSDHSSRSSSYSRSSSASSCSSSSSNSRTRSRSGTSSRSYSSWHTSQKRDKQYLRSVEERRVVYVGRLPINITREDLRKRFQKFGAITSTSLHTRGHGDNYGFVTFANKLDAYEAIEHGNDDPHYPKYDLSFGGRRIFCKTTYSDLDNVQDEPCSYLSRHSGETFDALLREVQEKLRKRKA